jgi:hypothetical protein
MTVQKRPTKKTTAAVSKDIEQSFDAALPFSKVFVQLYRRKLLDERLRCFFEVQPARATELLFC